MVVKTEEARIWAHYDSSLRATLAFTLSDSILAGVYS